MWYNCFGNHFTGGVICHMIYIKTMKTPWRRRYEMVLVRTVLYLCQGVLCFSGFPV